MSQAQDDLNRYAHLARPTMRRRPIKRTTHAEWLFLTICTVRMGTLASLRCCESASHVTVSKYSSIEDSPEKGNQEGRNKYRRRLSRMSPRSLLQYYRSSKGEYQASNGVLEV